MLFFNLPNLNPATYNGASICHAQRAARKGATTIATNPTTQPERDPLADLRAQAEAQANQYQNAFLTHVIATAVLAGVAVLLDYFAMRPEADLGNGFLFTIIFIFVLAIAIFFIAYVGREMQRNLNYVWNKYYAIENHRQALLTKLSELETKALNEVPHLDTNPIDERRQWVRCHALPPSHFTGHEDAYSLQDLEAFMARLIAQEKRAY